jgi:acyl dehydratase
MPRMHFEDFVPGTVTTYGSYAVTRQEIVSFASQFDPQPMHLDEAAAAGTLLGGLGASGWHVCAMLMRMLADNVLSDSAGIGAPGIDEVRWLKPVRPGDVLGVRQTVLDAKASRSLPDRGFVRFRFEVLNGAGEVVMEQSNSIMFRRRAPRAEVVA